jgi:hypothetical protein
MNEAITWKAACTAAFVLLVCLIAPASAAQRSETPIGSPVSERLVDRNGFLLVNGKARLMIGLYELPEDDEKLKEIAESGFNLVRAPQDVKALDRVDEHNVHAWICLGAATTLGESDPNAERRVAELVSKFKDHPALLVWELPDEAVWNVWWSRFGWAFGGQQRRLREHIEKAGASENDVRIARWSEVLQRAEDYGQRGLWRKAEGLLEMLWSEIPVENPHPNWKLSTCAAEADELTAAVERGCQVVRKSDSRHIIWQNHAPRNSVARLRQYNRMVDAAGCDIYPVPFNHGAGHSDLKDTNLSSVGEYTERMRQAAPGKAIWMVLQGFGWRDLQKESGDDSDSDKGRRPGLHETRFMAYDAIVRGANAVLYWGTHYIEKDSVLWKDLMKTAKELRALEPAILGRVPTARVTAAADETYGSIDGQGPRLMLCKTEEDWVLIAVNEHSQGISFAVNELPSELDGRALFRLYSDETHTVKSGYFHDGIRGFGVHIYATSRRFEVR